MARKKIYYCDCEKLCKKKQRQLPKSTYFRHKKHQDEFSKYSQSMQDFLNAHPVVVHASPSCAAQHSYVHVAGPSDENTDRMLHTDSAYL